MKKIEDVAVIITARVTSERLNRKMVRTFAGSTLIDIALEKVKVSSKIPLENFYLSAYDQELIEIGHKHGVNVFRRSEESMRSEGQIATEIYEWWDKLPFTYAVLINACIPLLKTETIDKFFESYLEIDDDGLYGVFPKKTYYWDMYGNAITPWTEGREVMDTKVVNHVFEGAGTLYAGKMSKIGEGIWMGRNKLNDPRLFVLDEEECIEVDHQWQFDMCEILYKRRFQDGKAD